MKFVRVQKTKMKSTLILIGIRDKTVTVCTSKYDVGNMAHEFNDRWGKQEDKKWYTKTMYLSNDKLQ